MQFPFPLQQGTLLRRYKRFLADVQVDAAIGAEGELLTVHCANTGSMKNCCEPGSRVWFWDSGNDKRKYRHTWELVEIARRYIACINTGRANSLVVEAIKQGVISELQGYDQLRTEVKYGAESSRIDVLLSDVGKADCYIEVKNVTLLLDAEAGSSVDSDVGAGRPRQGAFPDAVSTRGTKHLRELMAMVAQGERAVLLFCVAHTGIEQVVPADMIDPLYGKTLRAAMAAGVEVYAYGMTVSGLQHSAGSPQQSIALTHALPVVVAPLD